MSTNPNNVPSSPAATIRQSPSPTSPTSDMGNAVQTILTGRKCWRIMKGKDEAVWPPELEAALIEGLERYRPAESRSTRALGRFPMRNKFISDYILKTTGKHRTPKQVGSRIQQLRDTSSGKHILKTLSDRHYEMMHPSRPVDPPQESAQQDPSTSGISSAPPSNIYIQVLPPSASHSHSTHSGSLYQQTLVPFSGGFRTSCPRTLRQIDPTVAFSSAIQTPCYSSFKVFQNSSLVHSEMTSMEECSPPTVETPESSKTYFYRTTLVPTYWLQLCAREDITSFTISQEICRSPDGPSTSSQSDIICSFNYHFTTAPPQSRSLSPVSSSAEGPFDYDYAPFSPSPSPSLNHGLPYYFESAGGDIPRNPGLTPDMDDLLIPELVLPGEDGYHSFPSSPSEVAAIPPSMPWRHASPKTDFLTTHELDDVFSSFGSMSPQSYGDVSGFPDFLFSS